MTDDRHSFSPQTGSNLCVCGYPISDASHVDDKAQTLRDSRRIANLIDALMVERHRLILKAHAEGASLREIGNAIGVNHVTVKNIIDR